jgi:hypothetical protein
MSRPTRGGGEAPRREPFCGVRERGAKLIIGTGCDRKASTDRPHSHRRCHARGEGSRGKGRNDGAYYQAPIDASIHSVLGFP